MNAPDERIFAYRGANGVTNGECARKNFVLMYHGSLVERHGLDLAVQALAKVKENIPNVELRVYGEGTPFLEKVLDSISTPAIRQAIHWFGAKKLNEIAAAIAECDLGIIPNRRSIFTEINTPTRIFEYLSQGKAVVAPSAPGIQDYFGAEDLIFFELGDAVDLAEKIQYAYAHPQEVHEIVRRGQEVYLRHSWRSERRQFLELVERLIGPGKAAPVAPLTVGLPRTREVE
jgi:glycosyltransferase involved in cell wall biosynthesis